MEVSIGSDRKTPGGGSVWPERDERYEALARHHQIGVESFNRAIRDFKATGKPLYERFDELLMTYTPGALESHVAYADDLVARMREGNEKLIKGYLGHDDWNRAVIETVGALAFTDKHVAAFAPPQTGKTAFENMVTQVANMWVKANDLPVTVLVVPFGRKAPAESAIKNFIVALNVGANLKFRKNPRVTLFNASRYMDDNGQAHVMRNTRKQIEQAVKRAEAAGHSELWLVLDEADHGMNLNGIMDNFYRDYGGRIKLRLVLVSATPEEYAGLDAMYRIEVEKDETSGYYGLIQGKWLPINGLTRVADRIGLPGLRNYEAARQLRGMTDDVCKMIERVTQGIDAPELGFNGLPVNGGRCIVLRAGNNVDSIVRHLRANYGHLGLNVINHYGRNLRHEGRAVTVADAISRAPDGPCLLVLKGTGRRADEFPIDRHNACTVFIDLTPKYSTNEAFRQGLIGRASGYKNDNVVVIVSDENMRLVSVVRSTFRTTKEQHGKGLDIAPIRFQRAFVPNSSPSVRFALRKSFMLRFADLEPALADALCRNVRENLLPLVKVERVGGEVDHDGRPIYDVRPMTVAQAGMRHPCSLPEKREGWASNYFRHNYVKAVFGDMDTFRLVEEYFQTMFHNADAALLEPGVVREDGKHFSTSYPRKVSLERLPVPEFQQAPEHPLRMADEAFIPMSFNFARRVHGGPETSNRDARGRPKGVRHWQQIAPEPNAIRPELLLDVDEGTGEVVPVALHLHLASEVEDRSIPATRLARSPLPFGSAHEYWANDMERAEIEAERERRRG